MTVKDSSHLTEVINTEGSPVAATKARTRRQNVTKAGLLLVVFVLGAGSGYLLGQRIHQSTASQSTPVEGNSSMALMDQINPPEGYSLAAVYGDIGPQLVATGAIDMSKFTSLYQQQNKPLGDDQVGILTLGSTAQVQITPENAYFLLNFFWALGLTNENPILTEGAMVGRGIDQVGSFASTGGWTLGSKPATELYAKRKIVGLSDVQQARLEQVASLVYRPCCNNPTDFPDCNHGMAMLGLLELMASQDASIDQMFEAAKYVTSFWYPRQMLEVATAIKALQNLDFVKADAKQVVSSQYSSISGFQSVHQWLATNGLLPQAPSGGGSCGVQ